MVYSFIQPPKNKVNFKQELSKIDFIGIGLWAVGVVTLVLGLSWGGSTYGNNIFIYIYIC